VFEGHFIRVIPEFVKAVPSYLLIADIDAGAKPGEIDIYPVGVFGYGIEVTAVPDDVGIYGVFESIREVRTIEGLVLVRRKIYFEISSSFGRIDVIAGVQGKNDQEQDNGTEQAYRFQHVVLF